MFVVDYGGNNKSVKKEMQHNFSVSVNNRLNNLGLLNENQINSIVNQMAIKCPMDTNVLL